MTKGSLSTDDATGQAAALSRPEETIGSFLKRHRQNQGKDLDEIAEKTRIHASTLRAIEEGNPKALPAEVFTRGFIRNYARYLGLDPDEALAWYSKENKGEANPTEKINVRDVLAGEVLAEARTFPVWSFIVFFLVAALLFLAGYFIFGFSNSFPPSVDMFTLDAQPQTLVGPQPLQTALGTGGEPVAKSGAGNRGTEQASPVTQGGTPDSALSLPGKDGQLTEPRKIEGEQGREVKRKADELKPVIISPTLKEEPQQNSAPQAVARPAPSATALSESSVTKASGINYVLAAEFTEKTWLAVQIDQEKQKSFIYQPGDHAVWQAGEKISLLVGNAGGIVLTLNGKPVPPLGESMKSVRISFPAQ